MAATLTLQLSCSLLAASTDSSSSLSNFLSRLVYPILHIIRNRNLHLRIMLSLLLLFAFTLSFLVFSLYLKLAKKGNPTQPPKVSVFCVEPDAEKILELDEMEDVRGSDPDQTPHSLLLEILPSGSPKWEKVGDGSEAEKNGLGSVFLGREAEKAVKEKKKKKKRARKKRPDSNAEGIGIVKEKGELMCLYPYTTASSATQRRIKRQYDELVRFHDSNGLTAAQANFFTSFSFKFCL